MKRKQLKIKKKGVLSDHDAFRLDLAELHALAPFQRMRASPNDASVSAAIHRAALRTLKRVAELHEVRHGSDHSATNVEATVITSMSLAAQRKCVVLS